MHGSRLELRPWTEADASVLYLLASDPEVGPQAGWTPHSSVEESRQVIRDIFHSGSTWAITLRLGGEVVGCIGFYDSTSSNIPIGEHDIEIGYWIGRKYWNRGYCTEALGILLEKVCGNREAACVWADCFIGNHASRRVLEKCGFTDTGMTNAHSLLPGVAERKVRIFRLDPAEFIRKMIADGNITFHPATEMDVEAVTETALEAIGIPHDPPLSDLQRRAVELFRHACSTPGTMYYYGNATVVRCGSTPVGCFISYDGGLYRDLKDRFTSLRRSMDDTLGEIYDDETGSGEYYLDSIAVFRPYRGCDLGKTMIARFLTMARRLGFRTASLVCDSSHSNLMEYYMEAGFRPVGRIRIFNADYTRMAIRL